jgi:diguanylate cyclase (GGDEF)-like protein
MEMSKKERMGISGFRGWLFPVVSHNSREEIIRINMRLIRNVSTLFLCLTTILLVVYGIFYATLGSKHSLALFSLIVCVSLFVFVSVISRRWEKDPRAASRKSTSRLMELLYWLFSGWGIVVSWRMYVGGSQMMIMDTVQIGFMLLVCCYPAWGVLRILISYTVLLVLMFRSDGLAWINPAVYGMMIVMICFGVVVRYGMELRNIEMVRDIRRYAKSLEHSYSHDALTGMKNRTALREDFSSYCGKKVWVVMADVDHFKRYNDTYGHEAGDRILEAFAEKATDFFGEKSTYRYGGDEFLMIVENITVNEVSSLLTVWADAIRRIRLPVLPQEESFSCSYGYEGGTPSSEEELRKMIIQADRKLYVMKGRR